MKEENKFYAKNKLSPYEVRYHHSDDCSLSGCNGVKKDTTKNYVAKLSLSGKITEVHAREINEIISQEISHALNNKVKEIRKEIETLYVFGKGEAVGGPYSDEVMRGPNVERASWIKKEDVLAIFKSLQETEIKE